MRYNTLKKEEVFHNKWANSIHVDDIMVDITFEASTSPENRIILKRIGDIRGKKILELGCGAGEASVYFATKGAEVTATDVADGMLNITKKVAYKHSALIKTKKCSSSKIDFPDKTFDIVYAANLLHHVDIEKTLKEAHRVLKKGGLFVSWDPLAHNPIINVYRKLATEVRTEDEHPLKMSDITLFQKYFSVVELRMTWFFTLWLFLKFYLIDRVDPNKERYWKKILAEHKQLQKTYLFLEKLDTAFLKSFPFMKRYCWNVVVIAKK